MAIPARPKRAFWWAALLSLALAWPALAAEPPITGTGPVWVIELKDSVNPGSADYLVKGLAQAMAAEASLVVIQLDTPGGLVESMRQMVQAILASPVPVAVYVSPQGARAASAGAFIALAGHVAAMAPATNIGAAHPIGAGGEDIKGTAAEKAVEDLLALMTSLARRRDRPLEAAQAMVSESKSYDVETALGLKLVDLMASDLGSLLGQLEGVEVVTAAGPRRITSAGRVIRFYQPDWRERLLSTLASPNLAYLLMMIGLAGLYFELSHPGAIFPGVVGAVSLLLAFFAMSTLPVSLAGLAMILLAMVMFFLEIKVASHGLLSLAGAVALVLGSLMLFDGDDQFMKVSLMVLAPSLLAFIAFFGSVAWLAGRAQLKQASTGSEGLMGCTALVVDERHVRVMGELWRAVGAEGLAPGARVKVKRVEGLLLQVEPVPSGKDDPVS
jgi:membrane-bound serine protease (ClpP class)